MNKYVFITMFLFAGFASAQTIIFKGGMSVSRLSGDEDMDANLGFSAGIGVAVPLKGRFSLQPEILFVQKGAKREISSRLSSFSYGFYHEELVFNYLEIPVLAKLTVGKKIKYFAYAGPFAGHRAGRNAA